jgi:hypothetical protein
MTGQTVYSADVAVLYIFVSSGSLHLATQVFRRLQMSYTFILFSQSLHLPIRFYPASAAVLYVYLFSLVTTSGHTIFLQPLQLYCAFIYVLVSQCF